jgi:ferredoxin
VTVVAERVTMRTVRKRLDARHVVEKDTPPLSHALPSCPVRALELEGEGTDKGRSKDN